MNKLADEVGMRLRSSACVRLRLRASVCVCVRPRTSACVCMRASAPRKIKHLDASFVQGLSGCTLVVQSLTAKPGIQVLHGKYYLCNKS